MSNAIPVRVVTLPHFQGLTLPTYAKDGDACFDFCAAVPDNEPVVIHPGRRIAIPTGLSVAIPHGYEIQCRPRSGLALKHGIVVANSPGTIDSGYRGEIKIILANIDPWESFAVSRGMRIAQGLIARVTTVEWHLCSSLPDSDRGDGGFGHTGV